MSLKIFNQQEKIPEEKKLETIVTEEGEKDKLVTNLIEYFKKRSSCPLMPLSPGWKQIFNIYMRDLKNFKITPAIIPQISENLDKNRPREWKRGTSFDYDVIKSCFRSALIQTSYNQGHNNFEFGDVNSVWFGMFLRGKIKKPIKIKVEKLCSDHLIIQAENCRMELKDYVGGGAIGPNVYWVKIYIPNKDMAHKVCRLNLYPAPPNNTIIDTYMPEEAK